MQLQRLNLGRNFLQEGTFLKSLTNLSSLYLSRNQITDCSFLKTLPKIDDIQLYDNPLINPTPDIVKQGIEAIRNYFKQLNIQGREQLYEACIMIVGEPGAGKSSLLKKLFDRDYIIPNNGQMATTGIDVRQNWKFAFNDSKNINAHIWDFGGQQIQYMLHQFFYQRAASTFSWQRNVKSS